MPTTTACHLECLHRKAGCLARYVGAIVYSCTRDRNHTGDHVACGGTDWHDLLVWPTDATESSLATQRSSEPRRWLN